MTGEPLERVDRPLVIFSGNFGSGKSEVAVNVAFEFRRGGKRVAIVDLDVVNPYFRCREAREALERDGVEVIAPAGEFADADLPIILPEIRGRIQRFDGVVILDVGGDDLGARALASLRDVLERTSHHHLMVLNERRPYTENLHAASATIDRIQVAARIPVTGLVGNTHLMEHTTTDTVIQGYGLCMAVSAARSLPLVFVTVPQRLYDAVATLELTCPVLPLMRRLRPPWLYDGRTAALPRPGRPWGRTPTIDLSGGIEK